MDSYFHFQLIYDFVFFRYVSSQPWQHRIGSSLRSGFAHLDPLCLVAGGTVGGLKGRYGGHVDGAAMLGCHGWVIVTIIEAFSALSGAFLMLVFGSSGVLRNLKEWGEKSSLVLPWGRGDGRCDGKCLMLFLVGLIF